jgi:hypothetical protein
MCVFGYFSHACCCQVYKIEHKAMQSPKTNFGSRTALLKSSVTLNVAPSEDATFPTSQFSTFSAQLDLPWSTVSDGIVKWKRRAATTDQP